MDSVDRFERLEGILAAILERNGLDRSDGRPLYAYRVDEGELRRIAHSLHVILGTRSIRSLEEGAAFCLYFAERFRTLHEGGVWKWETVLRELCPGRDGPEFYDAVERGLAWWRRHVVVVGASRRFIVTLACEGGLPLALLTREGTNLRRFFRRLLAEHEAYPTLDLEESASQLRHLLPRTLAHEDLFTYAARLVRSVAELREELGDVDDPILEIDRRGLRNKIPLRLDDAVARELLDGLLRAPRGEDQERAGISVQFELRMQPEPRVVRVPRFPATMEPALLQRILQASELPPRLQLALRDSDGHRYPFARATRIHEGALYQLEPIYGGRQIEGATVLGRFELISIAGGLECARAPIAGGEEESDLPWSFGDNPDEDRQQLVGVGSVASRRESLLVAVPEEASIQDYEAERVAGLPSVRRTLHRLRGTIRVSAGGEESVVRSGQERDDSRSYRLTGTSGVLGAGGETVWLGPPHVIEEVEERRPRQVDSALLQWKKPGEVWGPLDDSVLGRGFLRLLEGGETRFKAKLTVVPSEMACTLTPGPGRGEGRLVISGIPGANLAPAPAPGCSFEVRETSSGVELECHLEDGADRPRHLEFALVMPGGSRVELATEFPVQQIGFVGPRGRLLASSSIVGVDHLVGSRARVLTSRRNDRFFLEASGHLPPERLGDLHPVGEGMHELGLDEVLPRVQQMFASDPEMDGEIRLRIVPYGFETPGADARLRVRRFSRRLVVDDIEGDSVLLGIDPPLEAEDSTAVLSLRPMVEPLADPYEPSVRTSVGAWIVPYEGLRPGPWLATVTVGDHLEARPQCVFVPEQMDEKTDDQPRADFDDSEPRLVPAVLLPPERFQEGLALVVEQLGCDAGHPDWDRALEFLSTLAMLPSNTFELVKALAKDRDAVALAALKSFRKPWFPAAWGRMEEQPFMWCLVPVSSWLRAGRLVLARLERIWVGLEEGLRESFDPKEQLAALIRSIREQAPRRMPSLECVADVLAFELLGSAPEGVLLGAAANPAREDELNSAVEEHRQEMMRRHADRERTDWPSAGLGKLLEAVSIHPQDPLIPWIKPCRDERASHRNDVLNGPVVSAAVSVLGDREALPQEAISYFQRLRGFDSGWFDQVHAIMSARLLSRRLADGLGD